ncbi:c-type cytochrome [Sulfurimonas sp. HSL-1716]|uniref:c-type cytochrome n=1 Tax=Hydrocurvibacter sulfurireducens TaxID=3131937 RepID=UPI0031F89D64
MKKIVIASVAALAVTSSLMAAAVQANKCAGCHGKDFEKKALGQSKIVKDMTHAEIAASLKGYRDTAGFGHSPAKGVMAGQVKSYTDAELEAFSKTVGK